MKKTLVAVAILALSGCSVLKKDEKNTSVTSTPPDIIRTVKDENAPKVQSRMSNNFPSQGIKFEWQCEISGKDGKCVKGEPHAIEVTASAHVTGNTEAGRQAAARVAELRAKAKLRHFIHEEVFSSNTVTTLSKTVERVNEKANDSLNEDISMSDEEAKRDTNFVKRDSTNRVVKNVTETIRANASGILRGVYVNNIQMFEGRNVVVTIRWDRGSENIGNYLHNKFGG